MGLFQIDLQMSYHLDLEIPYLLKAIIFLYEIMHITHSKLLMMCMYQTLHIANAAIKRLAHCSRTNITVPCLRYHK